MKGDDKLYGFEFELITGQAAATDLPRGCQANQPAACERNY